MLTVDWIRVLLFLTLVVGVWYVAGVLRLRYHFRQGDTRKLNHITALVGGGLLFGWAEPDSARLSSYVGMGLAFPLLCVFCIYKNSPIFRTMFAGYARESDKPHEAFHVWFSWAVSLIGLIVLDLVFRDMEITRTAALVLGVADGFAEPVGVRWGHHQYQVKTLKGSPAATRSVEGSLTVFVGTIVVLLLVHSGEWRNQWLWIALAVTVVEAITHMG
jgi:phytol kinase